jgi:hypothetical protein
MTTYSVTTETGRPAHRHRPKTTATVGYTGPVAWPEHPAAHGNICVVDTCRCGAQRRTNINQSFVERGPWE